MKSINLPALGLLNFDDLGVVLSWLASSPMTEFSVSQIQKNPLIRSSKVNPVVKVLEQLAMIANKKERISITTFGREFAAAPIAEKKVILRTLLMNIEPIKRIQELLENSATGRLQRQAIHAAFDSDPRALGVRAPVQVAEVLAFISWAEACDLLHYDKKMEEIMKIGAGLPDGPNNDPRQSASNTQGLRLAS